MFAGESDAKYTNPGMGNAKVKGSSSSLSAAESIGCRSSATSAP
jgi:hypothetical protein